MKLRAIFVLVFFCFFNYSFSCDCPPHQKETMVQKGLQNSDIVFYGELIRVDTIQYTYDFRIIELFKGKYQSKIIHGKGLQNNCEIEPFKKDLWIVYANINKDNTISLSYCLPSQTMEIPPGFLPPIPIAKIYGEKITKTDSLKNDILNLKINNETLYTFFYQLEQLRAYKSAQNSISQKEKTDSELVKYAKYISIFLFLIIVLLSILIFIVFRKKSNSNNSTFS
ncbi:hypothetical protein GON26_02335 [Flavobacterium sp. GA093]|uniref:Tissue inhibitor of metalloproteinase n=1 Tax=Flavobacterium hydrocarbonoxydans TaxID=2683249 RepID=A0A6I4NPP5_9FLAO|nr:hypothetical protein [Flavobacterium hydrocarbonoxydans]MWB93184.1 hypothetical protein [Flavobacterium hydrocarbonoxydans]